MAQVAFSFSGTRFIRVTGAASAGSLVMVPGARVKAIAWSGGTTKGQAIRIKELETGATIFFDRLAMSYGGRTTEFHGPVFVQGGFLVSTFPAGEAEIYLA